jgi:hypothetical protein
MSINSIQRYSDLIGWDWEPGGIFWSAPRWLKQSKQQRHIHMSTCIWMYIYKHISMIMCHVTEHYGNLATSKVASIPFFLMLALTYSLDGHFKKEQVSCFFTPLCLSYFHLVSGDNDNIYLIWLLCWLSNPLYK